MATQPTFYHVQQPVDGYRYSMDAFLLAAFALGFGGRRWCDLGAGCGVISVQLARGLQGSDGLAIEMQPSLFRWVQLNLAGRRVRLVLGDLRDYDWSGERVDLFVCNPPYYELGRGRVNQDPEIARARHCFAGNLGDFMDAVLPAVHLESIFCAVLPVASWEKLQAETALKARWHLHSGVMISPFKDRSHNLVLCAFSPTAVETPAWRSLALYREHRVFTAEAKTFFSVISP